MNLGAVARRIELAGPAVENTLGLILAALEMPAGGRALDIGGAAYQGKESTRFLLDHFDQVHVLRPSGRDLRVFEREFRRVLLIDRLPEPGTPPYQLVAMLPNAANLLADLRDLVERRDHLIAPGGFVVAHGILPERLDDSSYLQPPAGVAQEFADSFAFAEGAATRLPEYLSGYRFIGYVARKTATRSYLAWYVLQKLAKSAARTPGAIEQQSACASLGGARKRVLMLVLNEVAHDSRVLKCARFVKDRGDDITVFGVSKDRAQTRPFATRIDGVAVTLFPHPRFLLRTAKIPSYNWYVTLQHLIATVWAHVEKLDPHIIHTHDFNMLKIGQEFVLRLRRNGRPVYWIHDFHEYVAGLTSIDDEIRRLGLRHQDEAIWMPDARLTVSPHLSRALAHDYGLRRGPTVLLNTNSLRHFDPNFRPTIREALGLSNEVPLAVYSGGVSRPRGVHTLVEALPLVSDLHVALLTNNADAYVDSLKAAAAAAGTGERLHLVPYVAPQDVPSFLRDATIGVHPMVHFPNAEVALPNKLFDYCLARLPVIVSDCRAMAEFVSEWGIGEVFRAESREDLAAALGRVIAERGRYVERITATEGFLSRFSWEAQCGVLEAIYCEAWAAITRDAPVLAGITPAARTAPP
ncbi:MAG: glycosyltransferase family 4 protein [Alphaproteobacteria bacterium]|nr:glycosyltransferase family 4 protein [Alphaproteobacteria bacterium]